jgi:hypothetical protein
MTAVTIELTRKVQAHIQGMRDGSDKSHRIG